MSERWLSVAGSLPKGDVRGMDGSGELGGVANHRSGSRAVIRRRGMG